MKIQIHTLEKVWTYDIDMPYALRPRMHNRGIPIDNKMQQNFIPRMITSGTY